jgi:hypothetical protein
MALGKRLFAADLETTVFKGQTYTEAWSAACVEFYTEDVHVYHSLPELFDYWFSLKQDLVVYFHNLKFDGAFILDWLTNKTDLVPALAHKSEAEYDVYFLKKWKMENNSYSYLVSDVGQWYSMLIKKNSHYIEIRDSLKLLPFSLKAIGEAFKTKHQKLDMEYKGFRYAGCTITDEEMEYIKNDVLVLKEALEYMYEQGHTRLTIGSCCLSQFKYMTGKHVYESLFPDLYDIPIDFDTYGAKTAGDYIHRSYHGGWCYLKKGMETTIIHGGLTADVNSLYPSVMHSESGSIYPYGRPTFWSGNTIPDEALEENRYFFVRIRTKFDIKPNHLPCIQLKGNFLYAQNEWLEHSDIRNANGKRLRFLDRDGNVVDDRVTLTLTMTDFYLIKEHYDLREFEVLDGCWFRARKGMFDEYIDYYKKIKITSKGAARTLAKLFLNNLYGKMAASKNSSFKVGELREDGSIGFFTVPENNKQAGYIAVGSAITSYARNFTIRAAQKNYSHFIYADTDSIHCNCTPEELIDIPVHPTDFCHWKLESYWDIGWFVRQKTYIEHVTHEDQEPIATPYYNVKCAGMPEKCKQLFVRSMEHRPITESEKEKYNEDEQQTIRANYDITDFNLGLKLSGKLMPKRIRGGIVLLDTTYEMR